MKKSIGLLSLTMGRLLFYLFTICICKSSNAQDNSVNDTLALKPGIYKTNILTYDKSKFIKGYLVNLSDSGLELSSYSAGLSLEKKNNLQPVYNYNHLREVTIRRKGSTGRGVAYGAVIGLFAGAIAGLASGDDPPGWFSFTAGQKAISLGLVVGMPAGALIGAIIGATAHKKFIIDGNKNKYDIMRKSIFKKLFSNHSLRNNYRKSHIPNI